MSKKRARKRCFLFLRHKIVYKEGFGYRCERCGKTPRQIREER